eukprot:gene10724-22402_t
MSQYSSGTLLPNLPGYKRQNPHLLGDGAPRKQIFYHVGGFPFVNEEVPPLPLDGSSSTTLLVGSRAPSSSPGKRLMSQKPGPTLTFFAFFEEMALHTRLETKRVRKCVIFFYEDDNEIMIVERPQMNSGMTQGTILKRTIPSKEDGSLYTREDFKIGGRVKIFGTTYNIIDGDKATRDYTGDETPARNFPYDAFEEQRKSLHSSSRKDWGAHHTKKNELKKFIEAKLGNTVDNKGREGFLRYGNMALKFLCVWDDTASLYGDINDYTLTYYLSDDTIEVFSIPANNSGKEQFTRLLRRGRLPKGFEPGSSLLSIPGNGNATQEESYHWTDISVGTELVIYGRTLVVVDADENTRRFYEDQNCALNPSMRISSPKHAKSQREIPPHNGFGSEEDSLQSCIGPLSNAAPPKKRIGENKILSFVAELMSGNLEDAERRFIVTYYVTDGTLKVHEIPCRNSGFVGGVFLSRNRVKGLNQEFVSEENLFLGAKIVLQKHLFHIIDTNENTIRWMEAHKDQLPRADFTLIIDKCRNASTLWEDAQNGNLLKSFENKDRVSSGKTNKEVLRNILKEYSLVGDNDVQLCEHELVTIVRCLSGGLDTFEYRRFISELVEPSAEDF